MTRNPPPEDWVVYAVVLGVSALIMLGKYLMGRGDKDEFISTNEPKNSDSEDIKKDA